MSRDSKHFDRDGLIDTGKIISVGAMVGGQSLIHGWFVAHATEAQTTIGGRIEVFGLLGTIGCYALGGVLHSVDRHKAQKEADQNELAELKTRLPELVDGEDSCMMHKRYAGFKALGDLRLLNSYLPRWFERDAHFRLRSELDLYNWLDNLVDKMADDLSACSAIDTVLVFDYNQQEDVPYVGSVHSTMATIGNTLGLLHDLVHIAPASKGSLSWASLVDDRTRSRLKEAAVAADASRSSELFVDSFQRPSLAT